jgi:N-acyl amino acid synthase FeeM
MPASAINQRLQDNGDAAKFQALRDALTAEAPVREADVEARGQDSSFRTVVAADLTQRDRAFRLAYRVYRDCAYVPETQAGRLVSKFDADPRTLVLLVQDSTGRDIATVSLVFDSSAGLPCDEVRGATLAPLRAQGRRLVEVTRLAIDYAYAGDKALLIQLFNFMSVYARHEEGSTDCVIEVNPRHVNYYRRLLMFEPIGPELACPRVNGARGQLLRLDLAAQAVEIGLVGGTRGQARGPRGRTLYSHFCALDGEPQLAAFIRSQQRPMTAEERRYFHLEGVKSSPRPAHITAGAGEKTPAMTAYEILPGFAFNAI